MRLTLINPETMNVNLIKEGAIPYHLFKHCGYKVTVVCHKSGEYPYATTLVNGIELKFIDRPTTEHEKNRRSLCNLLRGPVIKYLKDHALEIDILHLTGFSKETLVYSYMYKKYNARGIVYVKCDADYGIIHIDYLKNRIKRNLLKHFFNKVDFYSLESSPVLNEFRAKYPSFLTRLINQPIPCLLFGSSTQEGEVKKEKIILTVARIGAYQKNTELLLRAFLRMGKEDWLLVMVGPVAHEFHKMIEKIMDNNPAMRSRILMVGNLIDREKLFEWYQRSAIFCLPSRYESFGISLLEASAFGCYPITTGIKEIPAAFDITKNWEYGACIASENDEELYRTLVKVTDPSFEGELRKVSRELRDYINKKFDGKNIVRLLDEEFTKKISGK